MRIDKRYQEHAKALIKSGLAPKIFTTLKEMLNRLDVSKIINDANREKRIGGRG